MSGLIVYVDDEPSNLIVFESAMKHDFPVKTARSPAEALELLRSQDVAVLLSDQRMPGMTGAELLAMAEREFPDVARMLVTAYSDLDAAVDAINKSRVHQYVRKPWEPNELKRTLTLARDGVLAKRRLGELERHLAATERTYALGVVAAGVAHELRNPLSALSMNLDLLRVVVAEELSEPVRAQTLELVTQGQAAIKAMRDITASVELSTRRAPDGPVDLKEVVELSLRVIKGELRRRGRLESELLAVPKVRGSTTRFGQVVVNLLVNALQALDPVRHKENVLRVKLSRQGDQVELVVADTGPGIPADVLPRIFDPFFTTKHDGGTGLGLAISRQIMTELGGTIEVESAVGFGTRFTVRVPTAAA